MKKHKTYCFDVHIGSCMRFVFYTYAEPGTYKVVIQICIYQSKMAMGINEQSRTKTLLNAYQAGLSFFTNS